MKPVAITGKLITRNWAFNLLGQGLPLVVGLFTIPWLLRYLGVERFGVLSITWAVLGYVGQFDLGLGRATTRYVADSLGRGANAELPALVWTSLFLQLLFGGLAGLVTAAIIPLLLGKVLNISPAQVPETRTVLLLLAASFPLIVVTNSLRGVLEAAQHFAFVNYVRFPLNVSVFLVPALSIPFHLGLPGIVFLLILARLAAALAYLVACFYSFPVLRRRVALDWKQVGPLFVYGGWVTVSNLVAPLFTYVDRFFVGALLSMSAVGYYSAPYEIATKIWLFPATLLATVFPAFTSLHAGESQQRLEQLYVRSVKSILLVSGFILLVLAAFSRQLLSLWLGADFAARGTSTLQILCLGVLINSVAFVPFGLLQGLGRPDLTAKFHLLELPFYLVTLWLLLLHLGLPGAALAWTLRVAVDTLLLSLAVFKLKFISGRAFAEKALQRAVFALALPAALLALSWTRPPMFLQVTASALVLLVFVTAVWSYVLDSNEKNLLLSMAVSLRPKLQK